MKLANFVNLPAIRTGTAAAAFAGLTWSVSGQEAAPTSVLVYKNDFEEAVETKVWAGIRVTTTPNQGRTFLGRCGDRHRLTMRLKDLPPHRMIRLKGELLTLRSFDGNHPQWGPDVITIRLKNGPLLFHSSFTNRGSLLPSELEENPKPGFAIKGDAAQSFPDEYPVGRYRAATGAREVFESGLNNTERFKTAKDSIYDLDLVFPHQGKELALSFFGNLQSGIGDESWGLDSVQIETLAGPVLKSAAELDEIWKAIAGDDPVKAHRAVWAAVEGGADALATLENRLKARSKELADTAAKRLEAVRADVNAHIKQLEAESFKDRKAAKEAIVARGTEILPLIEEAIKSSELPETKVALKHVLQTLKLKGDQSEASPADFAEAVLESRMNHIRRIVSHGQRNYRVTSSGTKMNGVAFVGAPNDGAVPARSDDRVLPNFNWGPAKGSVEWLQYEFPAARAISSAEVFWRLGNQQAAPAWWEVLYKNAEGAWVPVKADARQKECERDAFQKIEFPAVKTSAVRLSVQLSEAGGAGIFEFRVGEKPAK